MITHPHRTLYARLHGEPSAPVEVLLLALLTVFATFPISVARMAFAAEVNVTVAVRRLFSLDGLFITRLHPEIIFCAVAGAGFFLVARLRRIPVRWGDALTAGIYLYVPMALVILVSGLVSRLGVDWPWLPHHPLDGWWVFEGQQWHPWRWFIKVVMEMGWPTVVGLSTAWSLWRSTPSPDPDSG